MSFVKRVSTYLLDLLYPPKCVFCGELLERGERMMCLRCLAELPCTRQGGDKKAEFVSVCVSPLYYEDRVRDSLLRYKFHGRAAYARTYGALLADCIAGNLAGHYDLITWIPLSRARLRERGYDQAELLAKAAARALGKRAAPTLTKVRNTARQSATGSAEKRRANISGAYRVRRNAPIAGRRVLLIDDILTTGATAAECARVLRSAGAAEVLFASLAQTRD